MSRRPVVWPRLVFCCLFSISTSLHAVCSNEAQPAATLLFPYFEVDLEDPEGPTTLLSINNVSDQARLVHVVMWTNWGLPTLAFDMVLAADEVRPMDLRNLFVEGLLPQSEGFGQAFPGCTDPLAVPQLTVSRRAILAAEHTGRELAGGLCWGGPSENAVGFLTVDVMNACSDTIEVPTEEGYFTDDGEGLGAFDNVLWGDFFLVDSNQDMAQGMAAVGLVADAERFNSFDETFYRGIGHDHRSPLDHLYRSRFLRGGDFDGGTDLLVWANGIDPYRQAVACELGPLGVPNMRVMTRTEPGHDSAVYNFYTGTVVNRLTVGEEPIPEPEAFGTLRVSAEVCCGPIMGSFYPVQVWVASVMKAENRFSVSSPGTALFGPCQD